MAVKNETVCIEAYGYRGVNINPNLMRVGAVYSIPVGSSDYCLISKNDKGKVAQVNKYSFGGTPKCGYDLVVKDK